MMEYATLQDLADAGVDVSDEKLAQRRLTMAASAVALALRGCRYDDTNDTHVAAARQATVAQAAALTSQGVDPFNLSATATSGRVIGSKTLQSASISYADSDALVASAKSVREGMLSAYARGFLAGAGLTPTVQVIG